MLSFKKFFLVLLWNNVSINKLEIILNDEGHYFYVF